MQDEVNNKTIADARGVLPKRTSNQSFTIAKSDWQQNQLALP